MEQSTAEVWQGVLDWLSTFDGGAECARGINLIDTPNGRGLVAARKIPPSTILISVPNKALVNTSTLQSLYPRQFTKNLTSNQAISLHLALQTWRQRQPPSERVASTTRDRFWPFLATLPKEFPSVPLTWMVGMKTVEELVQDYELSQAEVGNGFEILESDEVLRWRELIKVMPRSVRVRALDVENRFRGDWLVVRKFWNDMPEKDKEKDELRFDEYLVGWLNVNTRCVWMELGGKSDDNLTLAPVIDMINHGDGLDTRPAHSALALTFSSPAYGSSDPPLLENTELSFSYGPHEDPMLLTEYGFTLGSTNAFNNVNVDREIEALFKKQGAQGVAKKEILEETGYWGGMTIQGNPSPASPSWRVLVALRLLHLRLPSYTNQKLNDDILEPFYQVIQGLSETISDHNEKLVVESLKEICEELEVEFVKSWQGCLDLWEKWLKSEEGLKEGELKNGLRMLKGVCEDERRIVAEVLEEFE